MSDIESLYDNIVLLQDRRTVWVVGFGHFARIRDALAVQLEAVA